MCVIPRRSFGSGVCGNGGIGGTTKLVTLLLIFPSGSALRVSCSLWRRTITLSLSFTFAMYSNRFWMYSFGYGRVRDNGAMSEYCGIFLLWFRVLVMPALLASPPDGDGGGFALLVNDILFSDDSPIEEFPPLLLLLLLIRNALMSRSDNFVIDFSFAFFAIRSSIVLGSGVGSVFTGNILEAEPSPEEVGVAFIVSAFTTPTFPFGEAVAFDGCNEGTRTGSGYNSSGTNLGKCRQNLTSLSNMSSTTRCTLDPRCGASVLASIVYPAVAIVCVKTSLGDTIVVVGWLFSFAFALLLCAFCPRVVVVPGGSNRPGEDSGVMRMLRMEPRFLVVEEGIPLVAPPEIAAEEEEDDNDCILGCCDWRCIVSFVLFLLVVVVVVDAAAFVFGFGLVFCLEAGWGFGTFFSVMLALFSMSPF